MRELLKATKLNFLIAKNVIYFILVLSLIAGLTWRLTVYGPILTIITLFLTALLTHNLAGKIRTKNYIMYDLLPIDYKKRIISIYLLNTLVLMIALIILTLSVMLVFGFRSGDEFSSFFTGFGENGLNILSFFKRVLAVLVLSIFFVSLSLFDSAELSRKARKKKSRIYNSISGLIYLACILAKNIFFTDFSLPMHILLLIIIGLSVFFGIKSYIYMVNSDMCYGEK